MSILLEQGMCGIITAVGYTMSEKTKVPGKETIAALREGLTNVTRIVARQYGSGAMVAEISQHLLALLLRP